MKIIHEIIPAVLASVLSVLYGCAATGMKFSEYNSNNMHNKELIFYRPQTSLYASGSTARIFIDGKQAGSCQHRGFAPIPAADGIHMVYVDTWDLPGECWASADMTNATRVYFELDPKASVGVAGAFGGYMGAASAASGKPCGGYFTITPVPESVALEKLKDLRMTQ